MGRYAQYRKRGRATAPLGLQPPGAEDWFASATGGDTFVQGLTNSVAGKPTFWQVRAKRTGDPDWGAPGDVALYASDNVSAPVSGTLVPDDTGGVQARWGNTDTPDAGWSDWSEDIGWAVS